MAVDKEFVRRVLTEQRVKKVETNEELAIVMQNGIKILINDLQYIGNTICTSKGVSLPTIMQYGFTRCENLFTKEEMYKIVDVFMEFPYLLSYFTKTFKVDRTEISEQPKLGNLISRNKVTDKEISLTLGIRLVSNMLNPMLRADLFSMIGRLDAIVNKSARPNKKEIYTAVIADIYKTMTVSHAVFYDGGLLGEIDTILWITFFYKP